MKTNKTLTAFAMLILLVGVKTAIAQTNQISQVKLQYIPIPQGVNDTMVKVFCKIDFSDTIPIKKIHVNAGTSAGASNTYSQVINYKGGSVQGAMQSASNNPLQKVGKSAYVKIGTFYYQDLFYTVKAERMDGSFTPVSTFTSENH